MNDSSFQKCINPACASTFDVAQVLVSCPKCGGLLDILYDWEKLPKIKGLGFFEHRWSTKGVGVQGTLDFSGVWRFRELLPFYRREDEIVTIGEGRTVLQQADLLVASSDIEGDNFRELGLTAPVAVIPVGVDVSDRPEGLCQSGMTDREKCVLFLARQSPK